MSISQLLVISEKLLCDKLNWNQNAVKKKFGPMKLGAHGLASKIGVLDM